VRGPGKDGKDGWKGHGESGSELSVLLCGAWDWRPDCKSPSKRLCFSSLMPTCSCMEVLLLGHSDCAWAGLRCRGTGSQSRLVTAVSGRLRSAS